MDSVQRLDPRDEEMLRAICRGFYGVADDSIWEKHWRLHIDHRESPAVRCAERIVEDINRVLATRASANAAQGA